MTMETNKIIKTVSLPVNPATSPTVSLHVIAKNGENVLGRLLDNIVPYVHEAHIILNDTVDSSMKVLERKILQYPLVPFHVQNVTSDSHQDLYFMDVPATYKEGSPLDGETFEGPFTLGPLLGDWAGLRNLGWDSKTDWRLILDVDDVVNDPDKLPGLLVVLSDMHADMAATKYAFGVNSAGQVNSLAYHDRLARNLPSIRWEGKTHEHLVGGLRCVFVEDCFSATDMKDNWGKGVRVPGRCFKVLYREARLFNWQVDARHLAYIIQESPGLMPVEWVSNSLLPRYVDVSTEIEEKAWVYCMVGEMWEQRGDFAKASSYFEAAIGYFPSPKNYFRLCRLKFQAKQWSDCIAAYEKGVALSMTTQIFDMGPVFSDSSKILVGQAYWEMGNRTMALEFMTKASKAFPSSVAVQSMFAMMGGKGEVSR